MNSGPRDFLTIALKLIQAHHQALLWLVPFKPIKGNHLSLGAVRLIQVFSNFPGQLMDVFDAAEAYRPHGLVILAGKDYGSGSSRDWAAKGPYLLGVRAVIAESYERIHRSNLVGMGVVPLQFEPGQNADSLGLTGTEKFTIEDDREDRHGQGVHSLGQVRHRAGAGLLQERRHPALHDQKSLEYRINVHLLPSQLIDFIFIVYLPLIMIARLMESIGLLLIFHHVSWLLTKIDE